MLSQGIIPLSGKSLACDGLWGYAQVFLNEDLDPGRLPQASFCARHITPYLGGLKIIPLQDRILQWQ
jgi:hypothetical protein